MTNTQYIVVTALQSLISAVLFIAYRNASKEAAEAIARGDDLREMYRKAEDERHKAVMDRIHDLGRTTSREEVARAVETLAAALTPRAGAAEPCGSGGKRPAKRPRRR